MPIEDLRQLVTRLNNAAGALTALGAALDARVTGLPLPASLELHVERLLAGLGADRALEGVTTAELEPVLAEIRTFALVSAKLVSGAARQPGWAHAEPELLQAAGKVSSGFPHTLKSTIVPMLDGLGARLDSPDAAFLDVGVGVAALSIEMARLWPALRVVGIDVWAPSLALAQHNVAVAGLGSRIELREQSVAELPDVERYDLGWIPSLFIPGEVIPEAIVRVARALRPGGWILFPLTRPTEDPIVGPLACIRTVCFGGSVFSVETIEGLMRDAGVVDIRVLPSPPSAMHVMMTGRRGP